MIHIFNGDARMVLPTPEQTYPLCGGMGMA